MTCEEVRSLLDAYLDREFDLMTSLRVEEHLNGCVECRQILDRRESLQSTVRAEPVRFALPQSTESRIVAAIRQSENARVAPDVPLRSRTPMIGMRRPVAAVCLLLIGGIVGGLIVGRPRQRPEPLLTEELISNHVRSLMAKHIFDVASTNQHTVKPWFAGNIDFSPPVLNLTDEGFPLLGGRLDYLNGHTVAALVYRRHQHWINLFVWPTSQVQLSPSLSSERGYNVYRWADGGMAYAAVSDVNAAELGEFVRLEQAGK